MTDILVPFEPEGTKAVVRTWLRKIGDMVAENDPLVELETDKVTQEVPAPSAGMLTEILLTTDAEAAPGAVLGRLAPVAEVAPGSVTPRSVTTGSGTPRSGTMSPAVRHATREHGVDPATITATGRNGRVTRADVDHAVSARPALSPSISRVVPHDRMRLAIAENMLNSVTVAPHVTAVFEADFSAIIAHRNKHKAAFERAGANLTITAYLVAASVVAMRAVPVINSRWHADRLEIFGDINVGVGTALGDKGLVVPVLAKAQQLSLADIAARLSSLVASARANRLAPADVRGGTFTISNHGVSGSLFAAPIIIAQPQSAILGVGKLEKRVVVREVDGIDTIQIRPICYVSLTIDHRAVDGHQTNMWLAEFIETLETWPLDS